MVKLTPPPANVQDRAVYDYLYQLQEYLSVALHGGGDAGSVAVQQATQAATKQASAEIFQQVQYLKALIIKTADTVESHTAVDLSGLRAMIEQLGDVIEGDGGLRVQLLAIQNDYVAQSIFGSFQESITQQLNATASSLTQYVTYNSELLANMQAVDADFEAWRIASEGYIRSGIVDFREDTTPIIGIAIGQNLTTEMRTVNGAEYEIIAQAGFRAIYAADELSFWQDDVKVAYMSNNQLYITDVTALATLRVGKWKIEDGASGLVFRWEG